MSRTPLEIHEEIIAYLEPDARAAEKLNALLIEHAFASRALALKTNAAILRHMGDSGDPDDPTVPGLYAAADFQDPEHEAEMTKE